MLVLADEVVGMGEVVDEAGTVDTLVGLLSEVFAGEVTEVLALPSPDENTDLNHDDSANAVPATVAATIDATSTDRRMADAGRLLSGLFFIFILLIRLSTQS